MIQDSDEEKSHLKFKPLKTFIVFGRKLFLWNLKQFRNGKEKWMTSINLASLKCHAARSWAKRTKTRATMAAENIRWQGSKIEEKSLFFPFGWSLTREWRVTHGVAILVVCWTPVDFSGLVDRFGLRWKRKKKKRCRVSWYYFESVCTLLGIVMLYNLFNKIGLGLILGGERNGWAAKILRIGNAKKWLLIAKGDNMIFIF